MLAAILLSCALFALGIGLAWPFLRWPADPHYGVFCFWALTRKRGEPLPQQYVCNNQGFTRIFLNYLLLLFFTLAGKKDSLFKARLFQACVIALNGVGVYFVAAWALGLHPFAACSGAAIFLFMSTRPRFDFMRINCEHFYNLALLCLLPVFLLANPATLPGLLACMAAMALLTFVAVNAKIVYLGELGLLGLGLWVWRGMHVSYLLALAAAGLAALVAFSWLFRKRVHKESVSNFMHYARWAASFFSWQSCRHIYRTQFSKTPVVGLAGLALLGGLTGGGASAGPVIAVLAGASVLTVVAQCRLALYHMHCLLLSWSLAAALGLNWAYAQHPAVAAGLLALFVLSNPRAFWELPAQFRAGPLPDRLRQALGPDSPGYYDTRLELVVAHHRANPGPFLPWGICPQLYCLTGQKPHNTQFAYFSPGHAGFSGNQELLIQDLRRVEHPFIYDLSRQPDGYDSFNNIAAYMATGRAYAPEDRSQGITRYRLIGTNMAAPRPEFSFYGRSTPVLDALRVELGAGQDGKNAPAPDLLQLVAGLLLRKPAPPPDPALLAALLAPGRSEYDVRAPYAMALLALGGEAEQARELFRQWAGPENVLAALSPTLCVATWGLGRALGFEVRPPFAQEVLGQVTLREAADLARFLQMILLAEQLTPLERGLFRSALEEAAPGGPRWQPEGEYADAASRRRLAATLSSGGYADPALWTRAERVLLLRMAPMAMLETFLAWQGGREYAVSLATQQDSVAACARLGSFEAIVPLPTGPFSPHKAEAALQTLRRQHFTKGILVIHDTDCANWPEIACAMASLSVDAWHLCTDETIALGLVQHVSLPEN